MAGTRVDQRAQNIIAAFTQPRFAELIAPNGHVLQEAQDATQTETGSKRTKMMADYMRTALKAKYPATDDVESIVNSLLKIDQALQDSIELSQALAKSYEVEGESKAEVASDSLLALNMHFFAANIQGDPAAVTQELYTNLELFGNKKKGGYLDLGEKGNAHTTLLVAFGTMAPEGGIVPPVAPLGPDASAQDKVDKVQEEKDDKRAQAAVKNYLVQASARRLGDVLVARSKFSVAEIFRKLGLIPSRLITAIKWRKAVRQQRKVMKAQAKKANRKAKKAHDETLKQINRALAGSQQQPPVEVHQVDPQQRKTGMRGPGGGG